MTRPCLPWGTHWRGCPEPAVTVQTFKCCGKEIALCREHRAMAELEMAADLEVPGRVCLACGMEYWLFVMEGTEPWVEEALDAV